MFRFLALCVILGLWACSEPLAQEPTPISEEPPAQPTAIPVPTATPKSAEVEWVEADPCFTFGGQPPPRSMWERLSWEDKLLTAQTIVRVKLLELRTIPVPYGEFEPPEGAIGYLEMDMQVIEVLKGRSPASFTLYKPLHPKCVVAFPSKAIEEYEEEWDTMRRRVAWNIKKLWRSATEAILVFEGGISSHHHYGALFNISLDNGDIRSSGFYFLYWMPRKTYIDELRSEYVYRRWWTSDGFSFSIKTKTLQEIRDEIAEGQFYKGVWRPVTLLSERIVERDRLLVRLQKATDEQEVERLLWQIERFTRQIEQSGAHLAPEGIAK